MKSNAETSKSNKKSKGYGMKIAMAAGLGTLLVCGIVAIGLIAFSDLFSIKPTASPSREYNYNDPYGGLKPDKNNSKEKSLKVQYLGDVLYAGGQAVPDSFEVILEREDGSTERVTDYESVVLDDSFRLTEGTNTIEFTYDGLKASVDVNAVNVRNLPYPPNYVLRSVDITAARQKVDGLNNGTLSFADAFSNMSFTGDSQIRALATNGIISEEYIVARNGESYDFFNDNMDSVITMASGKDAVIVHYGINTLSTSAEERSNRINQYKDLLLRLKSACPDTRIIVSGVFPVCYTIFGSQQRFEYINDYDFELCEMCMEIGVEYLSDNAYMMEHQDVFGSDGLHLTKELSTGYWLKNLVTTMGL